MSKIYTKTGDKGRTGLVDGARVSKASLRINALGTLDEVNAWIGAILVELKEKSGERDLLEKTQSWLFACGSRLAEQAEESILMIKLPDDTVIAEYEKSIDRMTSELPPLDKFILPGGSEVSARIHIARTVVRRAERALVALQEAGQFVDPVLVRYLNRLSDWFFTLARWCNNKAGRNDIIWKND